MRRREFIAGLGSAAAWPLAARAQRPAMPVVAFVNGASADGYAPMVAAFRQGLKEAGYVEGQNVTVEYHWLNGQYDRLPPLMADLVRRRVAVIAIPGTQAAAIAAKAATSTIPIVFGVAEDPVKLGLVASLARPGGNATGVNIFLNELVGKRLELLHTATRDVEAAARAMALQIKILNASTSVEIHTAFERLLREPADALFVSSVPSFSFAVSSLRLSRRAMGCPHRFRRETWSRPVV